MEQTEFGLTAFPESENSLREALEEAPIFVETFKQPMKRCDSCKGMCCYHGAHINEEEAAFIRSVAKQEKEYFKGIGVELPEEVVINGEWRGEASGLKTALKPWNFNETVEDFPTHWENTACVFLTPEGYCGLQVYSKDCGLHPWWAKPMICWLHPVNFPQDGGIAVYDKESDPTIYEDYPGFNIYTRCGGCHADGDPAYQVLEDELSFLGNIVKRDLNAEIREAVEESRI